VPVALPTVFVAVVAVAATGSVALPTVFVAVVAVAATGSVALPSTPSA
jgi:hypothetical protein